MSPQQLRYQRVREVFLAVCELAPPQQDVKLAELCGEDGDLKSEVGSLLESSRRAEQSPHTVQIPSVADGIHNLESGRAVAGGDAGRISHDKDGAARSGGSKPATPRKGSGSRSRSPHSTRFGLQGRFATGTVLADRYRIVSLLGAGGMGEVYRADDLTLDQSVALKFLPENLGADQAWLDRFHTEVRLSREVTHANVCRVFDIGQVDGEQFISMEFVDGEDLASLLRRIGRLPRDKALQIARQLCAGIAAAHDKGVLHRDLKPANIMVDGRGQVRITDFGISATLEANQDASAGTPAYMAPEQFTRGEASVQSDIYSLGLVLYEIFSGKPAFSANSMPEYAQLHRDTSPTHPTAFVQDMDPLVERVILRCLEKEPDKRPPSALAVSAALPGGNPLAAALAAGETPSPQMVAAAGATAGMSVPHAAVVLLFTLVALVGCAFIGRTANLASRMPMDTSPVVLADRARQVLSTAGWSSTLRGSAQGFAADDQFMTFIRNQDMTAGRWDQLSARRPSAAFFWYRESPSPMISRDDVGMVSLDEPARSAPGMRTVVLGVQGRLKRLEILPEVGQVWDTIPAAPQTNPTADFSPLFSEADLKFANFTPVTPSFTPPMFADTRYAWQGYYPENPQQIVQVHAATYQGRPVYFEIVESWRQDWQAVASQLHIDPADNLRPGNIVLQSILILVSILSGVLLAWQNVRSGRGDPSGAHKLAAVFLLLGLLLWLLCASHTPQITLELRMFFRALGFILVPAGVVWMFYLGLEPYVRRIWPETVISWNRLLAGSATDPLVATHVLTGLAIGALATILAELANLVPMWMGRASTIPNLTILMRFLARDNTSAVTLWAILESLYIGMLYLLMLVMFQLILKRRWLASTAFVLVATAATVPWGDAGWVQWVQSALVAGLILFLLVRFGLVATLAALLAIYLMRFVPITSNMNLWYSAQTRFALGLLMIIAIAAATIATGGWKSRSPAHA
jgi:serine/threonine-protein kinase